MDEQTGASTGSTGESVHRVAEEAHVKTKRWQRRVSGTTFGLALSGALVLLMGSGGYLAWSYQDFSQVVDRATATKAVFDAEVEADAVIAERKRVAKIARDGAAMIAKAAEVEAAKMALDGYSPAGDHVYYRFANDEEFTCGYYDCAAVVITTTWTTCSGVYLEANLVRNEVVIGLANDSAGYLGENSTAVLTLEDYQDTGGAFQITTVNCH
ncbi:hypothetical protein [Cryobacterium sp. Y50]|uniref:hypothetical protein n=1 Tax=Cryobacterium sp. Y50 TaxID=2048286 RepID=UPI0011B0D90B|nr:hypothetical protein [Cryobacterium sp. Y50]